MKILKFLPLTLTSNVWAQSTGGSVVTFDPDDAAYEETVFDYLNSMGKGVFDDPYLLSLVIYFSDFVWNLSSDLDFALVDIHFSRIFSGKISGNVICSIFRTV